MLPSCVASAATPTTLPFSHAVSPTLLQAETVSGKPSDASGRATSTSYSMKALNAASPNCTLALPCSRGVDDVTLGRGGPPRTGSCQACQAPRQSGHGELTRCVAGVATSAVSNRTLPEASSTTSTLWGCMGYLRPPYNTYSSPPMNWFSKNTTPPWPCSDGYRQPSCCVPFTNAFPSKYGTVNCFPVWAGAVSSTGAMCARVLCMAVKWAALVGCGSRSGQRGASRLYALVMPAPAQCPTLFPPVHM